jgi:hypothetical protein
VARPLSRCRGILRGVKGDAVTSQVFTGIQESNWPPILAPQERFPPVIPSVFSPKNIDPARPGPFTVPFTVISDTQSPGSMPPEAAFWMPSASLSMSAC